MTRLNERSAVEVVETVRQGRARVAEVVEAALERIAEREPTVGAFAHLDPDGARATAARLDRGRHDLPLRGLPVGVKDLFDTADAPTEYGSPIYRGHRPQRDAEVVARLKDAGAVVLGKTVTTEFALFRPGKTTNPRHREHTPGGSSSGSAAAVADHMVAAAVGTQTAGSVIRPAAYCGVVGLKPTFGVLSRAGVKEISPSLDTVGVFARTVPDVALLLRSLAPDRALAVEPLPTYSPTAPPRIGFVRTHEWESAEPSTRAALEGLADRLAQAGALVEERSLPPRYADLVAAQMTVMDVEAARCLDAEYAQHADVISEATRALIERGRATPKVAYDAALATARTCREQLPEVFDGLDVLLAPAVRGEAPHGLDSTGDPLFCRAWTLLGCPALNLPLLTGPAGLPLGAQFLARRYDDERLLAVAQWIDGRGCTMSP